MTQSSPIRSQALELLGRGYSQTTVAEALGVGPSRISQLMEEPEFKEQVIQRRIGSLQEASQLDEEYHSVEMQLVKKLKQSMPLMSRPGEILRGIQIINQTKRRGAPDKDTSGGLTSAQVVNISVPVTMIQQFTSDTVRRNSDNQIIEAGTQSLITVQSSSLDKFMQGSLVENRNEPGRIEEVQRKNPREKSISVRAISAEDLE